MAAPTFVGVKNVSGKDKKLNHGGDLMFFKADEIKVVEASVGAFLLSRTSYVSEDGKRTVIQIPFKKIPLHEALKFAKEPENPSLAGAKAEADREEKIAQRVKEELLKAGWKAPEAPVVKNASKQL